MDQKQKIQLWFYKAKGNFLDKLIRLVTRSKYSHVELCIDGYCYSSSQWDGGVRRKLINFSDHWDKIELEVSSEHKLDMLILFQEENGKKYDWFGAIKTAIRFVPEHEDKFFCSEIVAQALGLPKPRNWTPEDLYQFFKPKEQ